MLQLDVLDSALEGYISRYPGVLLIPPDEPKSGQVTGSPFVPPPPPPPSTLHFLRAVLRFTSQLLLHSYNKHVYNSHSHLVLLLSAGDEHVARMAMEAVAR